MSGSTEVLHEPVTLSQAKLAHPLPGPRAEPAAVSPPGIGKSDVVRQAAAEARLPCKSLLGTQIAPEDVSGVPRIVGERSVFCPLRVLLPENAEPFCLFSTSCPPSRRTRRKRSIRCSCERASANTPARPAPGWSRPATEPRTGPSSAPSPAPWINRVPILNVRIDADEWVTWRGPNAVRAEIIGFMEGK